MIEVSSSGLTLRGIDAGPRDAPALVLIHAFPMNHTMWESQINALKETCRVIAMDIRGLGASDSGKFPATIDHLADDVLNVLEALRVERPLLCGCSLGGYIALRTVTREQDRFASVILADTRYEADDNTGKLNRSNTIREIAANGLTSFSHDFARKVLSPSAPETRPELVEKVRSIILQNSPEAVCAMQMTLAARADYEGAISTWKLPVVAVCGEHDQLTPPPVMRRLAEKIRGAQFAEIPGAGHFANMEQPDAFNRILKEALRVINP